MSSDSALWQVTLKQPGHLSSVSLAHPLNSPEISSLNSFHLDHQLKQVPMELFSIGLSNLFFGRNF